MHKVRINIMLCLWNSTVVNPCFQTRREISDLFKTNMYIFTPQYFSLYLFFSLSSHLPSLIFFRFLSCNSHFLFFLSFYHLFLFSYSSPVFSLFHTHSLFSLHCFCFLIYFSLFFIFVYISFNSFCFVLIYFSFFFVSFFIYFFILFFFLFYFLFCFVSLSFFFLFFYFVFLFYFISFFFFLSLSFFLILFYFTFLSYFWLNKTRREISDLIS